MTRKILILSIVGLVIGAGVGFAEPLVRSYLAREASEPLPLADFVASHPLQGVCRGTDEFTIDLYWSLPSDGSVNRLYKSADGGTPEPAHEAPVGPEAEFSEYRDTEVSPGSVYTYYVLTDNGIRSNELRITVSPGSCQPPE